MTLRLVLAEDTPATVEWTLDRSGRPVPGTEGPERIARIVSGLRAGGAVDAAPEAVRADLRGLVERVHGADYLNYLDAAGAEPAEPGGVIGSAFAAPGLTQDTPLMPGVLATALRAAAACALAATLTAADGEASYAVVRPPGHHAGPDWHGGYCFLNNAVIAARALQDAGRRTVALVDVDYHLGNGTLACLAGDASVPFASLHSNRPADFPYAFPDGPGMFGFAADPDPAEYLRALDAALGWLRAAGPDALVVSVGFDILRDDPHGSWSLRPELFGEIGAALRAAGLPTICVQEGGYGLPALPAAARAFAEGMNP